MRVKTIVDEDFINYKKPSMFIGTISCNGKCCIEANIPLSVCHNDSWRGCVFITTPDESICERYINNPFTESIVFGGLEPFEQFDEMLMLISKLRLDYKCDDDIVIYTGYNEDEIADMVNKLSEYKNIIIKFGRFVPDQSSHFDEVLGINLASDNQFARRIS